ncbi:MAG: hypothetical protein ACAH83_15140 [Alphaproteobacteria bacterium]
MQRIHAILLVVIFVICGAAAAHAQSETSMKERLVERAQKEQSRLKGIKRADTVFCRKMLADLKTGKNFEDPRPVATGAAALQRLKCKPARRLDEGSGNFTGYEYEMNENVDDGPEYVFVSEGAPGTDTWIKTVNKGTCVYFYPEVSGGRFDEEDLGEEARVSFSGLINYKNAPYVVHGKDNLLRIARFHADAKERLTKRRAVLRGANCVFEFMKKAKGKPR